MNEFTDPFDNSEATGSDESPQEGRREEKKGESEGSGGGGPEDMRAKVADGFRQGISALSAFKDALEESIQEARERGELPADRAKEIVQGVVTKARSAAEEAKERFDFVQREEFDSLASSVRDLASRLDGLQGRKRGEDDQAE